MDSVSKVEVHSWVIAARVSHCNTGFDPLSRNLGIPGTMVISRFKHDILYLNRDSRLSGCMRYRQTERKRRESK